MVKEKKEKKAKKVSQELEKVEVKISEEMTVMEQSEAAIVAAGELLAGYDSIIEDDTKRIRATTTSGAVAGAGINYLFDAAEEEDQEKRSELYRKGGITLLEVGSTLAKTLIAGNRRRMKKVK